MTDEKITFFIDESQKENPNYKRLIAPSIEHVDFSEVKPNSNDQKIEPTKIEPVKLNLCPVVLALFSNPMFTEIYYPFYETISTKLGYNGKIWNFFKYIHINTFISCIETFGKFDENNISEFKKLVLEIVTKSQNYNDEKSQSSIRNVMRAIILQQPIQSQPAKFWQDIKIKNLCIWMFEKLVKQHYLEMIQHCFSQIVINLSQLSSKTGINLSPLHFNEFLENKHLRVEFRELVYCYCLRETRTTKTNYKTKKEDEMRMWIEQGLAKFIFIGGEKKPESGSRILFFSDNYKLAKSIFMKEWEK